jgi:hypothetical protein
LRHRHAGGVLHHEIDAVIPTRVVPRRRPLTGIGRRHERVRGHDVAARALVRVERPVDRDARFPLLLEPVVGHQGLEDEAVG